MKKKSKGHVAFIGEHEYYKIGNELYRAPADKPLVEERRRGQFVTAGEGVAFALRMARLEAGEPE